MPESPLSLVSAGYGWRQTTYFTQPTDQLEVAAADPKRVYLGMFASIGNDVLVTTQPDGSLGRNLPVVGGRMREWYLGRHGPLCQAQWFLMPNGGSLPLTVFEVWKLN
jgi:hypothetical protein